MEEEWSPLSSNFDVSVMRTAQDAVKAKHAAVQAGYYKDPFIDPFAGVIKQPVQVIIKRGTFARVYCVYNTITRFCELAWKSKKTPQVIVLGAGKDTSFFRLLYSGIFVDKSHSLRWAEVDHHEMIREKIRVLEKSENVFAAKAGKDKKGVVAIKSTGVPWQATCHLCSYDLNRDPLPLIEKLMTTAMFDASEPTLIVLECVQMYMPVTAVDTMLRGFTGTFSDCHACSYEPILGINKDAFGKMMEENLSKTGVVHPDSCMVKHRTLQDYLKSFIRSDFLHATGCDMNTAYETILPAKDRQTANRCEFLDELEEWMLIMRHYCFVVCSNCLDSEIGKVFSGTGSTSLLGFQKGRCEEQAKTDV